MATHYGRGKCRIIYALSVVAECLLETIHFIFVRERAIDIFFAFNLNYLLMDRSLIMFVRNVIRANLCRTLANDADDPGSIT